LPAQSKAGALFVLLKAKKCDQPPYNQQPFGIAQNSRGWPLDGGGFFGEAKKSKKLTIGSSSEIYR